MIAAMNLGTTATVAGVVVMLVLALAAAAWAVLRANLATQTIELLKTNVEAQKNRADEAERENGILKAKVAQLETRVTNAEEMASGTKAIGELRGLLETQHGEMLDAIKGGYRP